MQTLKSKSSVFGDEEDYIKLYFDEINRTPLLDFEQEKQLSQKIKMNGDKSALEQLIKANLRLVVKIAKQYVTREYPLMDVIQDGNLGLMKAAERYDYRKEVRFSTYASWWIKQAIVRSLSLKKRLIRIPHRKEEKLRRIKSVWNTLYQENKRVPNLDELSKALKMDVTEIERLLNIGNAVVSFDGSVNNDECNLINLIEDNTFAPDEMVINQRMRDETRNILDSLVSKERTVLECRYGFASDEKHTLKKMGDLFGISAETVRQIEMKALKKIRDRYSHMKDYLQT